MARFQVKTLNNAREWDLNRKYKVNETVTYNGGVYQNLNGKQSVPTDENNWLEIKNIFQKSEDIEADKNSDTKVPTVKSTYDFVNSTIQNTQQFTSKIMFSLSNNVKDENVVVLSDSTGVGIDQWPYLLMLDLASKFPNVTVNVHIWNNSTLDYDSPILVQTGTEISPKILNYYIGAVSGSGVDYAVLNFENLFTENPDLTIISYGHNDNYANVELYKKEYILLVQKIQNLNTDGNVILIGQNPKSEDMPTFKNGVLNAHTIMEISQEFGCGFINVMQEFFDFNDYDLILLEDGIHPNSEGKIFMFNVIEKSFKKTKYSILNDKKENTDSIFIGASNFISNNATLNFNSHYAYYEMKHTNSDNLFTNVLIPSNWKKINTYALFTTPTNGTGESIVFDADFTFFENGVIPTTGLTEYAIQNLGLNDVIIKTQIHSKFGSTFYSPEKKYTPASFRIERFYDNASDTYNQNINFIGLLIERAV